MKDTLTSVILSIKPIYAQAIMNGTKKVEFRKKVFKKTVEKVFVYSSSPEKKIIGYFTVGKIVKDTPEKLWEKFNSVGGIDKDSFYEYYKDSEIGYSIGIKSFERFEEEIDPVDFFEKFCAPQSYIYLDEKTAANIGS